MSGSLYTGITGAIATPTGTRITTTIDATDALCVSFSNTVHSLTGRYPTIYTTTDWWTTCTGNYGGFGATNPLWIARYNTSPGTLPNGWSYQTFWQYADSGTFPGDQDEFNGSYDRLQAIANG